MIALRVLVASAALLGASPSRVDGGDAAGAVKLRYLDGALRGYPIIRDPVSGAVLGVATVTQSLASGIVHITLDTRYRDGLHVVESMHFRERATLEAIDWSVEERRGSALVKRYAVDFANGRATFPKNGEEHTSDLGVERTRGAYAGAGVMFAAKNVLPDLLRGASVDIAVVAFAPSPHVVTVTLTHGGREQLAIGGRTLDADRVVVHPNVPKLAQLVVKAPDTVLWFSHSTPPGILRVDTNIVEPSDPSIRLEMLGKP